MKILFTSDYQLGWKLYNNPELGQDLIDTFVRTVDVAINYHADAMVVCGDLFDLVRPSEELVKVVKQQVKRLESFGVQAIGLAGDHDLPNINGSTWINDVCGFKRQDDANKLLILQYDNDPAVVLKRIEEVANTPLAANIEFICFHGMVPELFGFIDEKKRLDFLKLDYKKFPNLHYIIGGDLHNANTLKFKANNGREITIEYCASPAVIKADEIGHKKGLLWYDGSGLTRILFVMERDFIKIDYTINEKEKFDISQYHVTRTGKKPVFIVHVDEHTKNDKGFHPLYQLGIVKVIRTSNVDGNEEVINIRSELTTGDRISNVLRECCKEDDVFELALGVITNEDFKTVLDQFKQKALA